VRYFAEDTGFVKGQAIHLNLGRQSRAVYMLRQLHISFTESEVKK
jgi:hypothetical protein